MYEGYKAFRTMLLAASSVAGTIGTRIYSIKRPQATALPAIVLHQVSGDRTQSHTGRTRHALGLLQVDCIANDYRAARALAAAVEVAATGYRGIVDGINIQGVFLQNDRDQMTETATAGDAVYTVQLDFTVHVSEA